MKRTSPLKSAFYIGLGCLLPFAAVAQLEWRVSVKFILDANGNLPTGGNLPSPAVLTNQLIAINRNLDALGRGYRLLLDEAALLSGVSQWFNYNVAEASKSVLEATAKTNAAYRWRTDAINVYVCGTGGTNSGGSCSFPSGGQQVILVAQNSFADVIIHEAGHFFSLVHTHDGEGFQNQDGSVCTTYDCTCAMWVPEQGDPLRITDTLLDHQCYTSSNQIALAQYGLPYGSLQPDQQQLVRNTWLNIMSYHSPGRLLTDDQLDRLTDASNGPRFNVATGRTWFVSTAGNDSSGDASSTSPYRSLAKSALVANSGDIVLLRAGNYDERLTIAKRVTLRATRGNVTVGRP